jgi:hypothetical protein
MSYTPYIVGFLLALHLVACRASVAGPSGPGASTEGSASGVAALPAQPDTVVERAEGTGVGATEGSARWAAAAVATVDLPDLVALMRRSGYPEAGVAQLDEFVPVPPGARGVAGQFANATGEVRVAVLAYPNEHYARPHESDIRERRRVVPSTPEAVARNGSLVLHVRAADQVAADALVATLSRELSWPAATP